MHSLSGNAFTPQPYPVFVARADSTSDFHECVAALREERGLTQQALADRIGGHESSDRLLFGKDKRGSDDGLRLQFEAISRLDEDEKRVVRSVLESMILKRNARRWQSVLNGGERE
jgi:transcriptional regulator with XRE-family HTH domain